MCATLKPHVIVADVTMPMLNGVDALRRQARVGESRVVDPDVDAAVLVGYPGSVASAWQQAGRAGRRSSTSVAVLVANSTALNQFIAKNPDYFEKGYPFVDRVISGDLEPQVQALVTTPMCRRKSRQSLAP